MSRNRFRIGSIAVLFVIGFVLFRVSCRTEGAKQV